MVGRALLSSALRVASTRSYATRAYVKKQKWNSKHAPGSFAIEKDGSLRPRSVKPQQSAKERKKTAGELLDLASKTKKQGFEPDGKFLNAAATVLHAATTHELHVAALPVCQSIANADRIHGNASVEVVRILHALGRHQQVVSFTEKLLKKDFFLTNPVLLPVLQSCTSLKAPQKGDEIFTKAKALGTIPNKAVYSAVVAMHAEAGDSKRAQRTIDEMKKSATEMNQHAYHNLMSAYARAGQADKVLELFEQMQDDGFPPEEHSYAILMHVYSEQGDLAKVKELMDKVKKTDGMQPSTVLYNTLLKACGRAHELKVAFEYYEEMKRNGITPDHVTFFTMMHAVYHGEIEKMNEAKVKWSMAGVGGLGAACLPFLNLEDHWLTALFCSSLVGSMGLAAYIHPNGVRRTLFPHGKDDESKGVIEAFFRRLHEEDHCGRAVYLWREMLRLGLSPDDRVLDVLVRTCVKKRHPEMAFEVLIGDQLPLHRVRKDHADGSSFALALDTTSFLMSSLLQQGRMNMLDDLYKSAWTHGAFNNVFDESKKTYTYDLRSMMHHNVRSYTIRRVIHGVRERVDSGKIKTPAMEFLVYHGNPVLDQIDLDDATIRKLFRMDEMTTHRDAYSGQYHYKLFIPRDRLQEFFDTAPKQTEEKPL